MSEFKFMPNTKDIKEFGKEKPTVKDIYQDMDVVIKFELAHQLKRIADSLEKGIYVRKED